jgi:hypothetical protein
VEDQLDNDVPSCKLPKQNHGFRTPITTNKQQVYMMFIQYLFFSANGNMVNIQLSARFLKLVSKYPKKFASLNNIATKN